MASRLLELLQCVAGQCPEQVGPLLASTATIASLLPLLQALILTLTLTRTLTLAKACCSSQKVL